MTDEVVRARDGTAGVIRGRIVVTDPEGGGRLAVLVPTTGVRVTINGAEVMEPTEVSSQDRIELKPVDEPGEVKVRVEISPDGLEARARVELIPGRRHILRDLSPSQYLVLATEVEKVVPCVDVSVIEAALKSKGVFVGVDYDALDKLAANPLVGPMVVARGVPPTPPKDAWIELKFERDIRSRLPSTELARVDWREVSSIPTVEPGAELAVKHPPVLGTSGLSVTGLPIEAPLPKDVELLAGEGCQVVGGSRIVATRSGRPTVIRGRVEVLPLLVCGEGVSLKTGNVRFSGNVVVRGDVEDNMSVLAGGDIEVTGSVGHATLKANGQILVRQNLIGGVALAGGAYVVHLKHREDWERLAAGLEDCAAALRQLARRPEFAEVAERFGWGQVLARLLDTKFRPLLALVVRLRTAYAEVEEGLSEDVKTLLEDLRLYIDPRSARDHKNVDYIEDLATRTKSLSTELKNIGEGGFSFEADYVQGARVEASGDIILHKGAYQSWLYAGRGVKVRGKPGVVRGGVVHARERVIAKEAGSPGGSPTLLKVGPKGVIEVETVYPNVTLQVGEAKHKFAANDYGIVARLDAKGELTLYGLTRAGGLAGHFNSS